MERKTGLEPATPTLARLCSTTELLPHVLATILLYHYFFDLSSLLSKFLFESDLTLNVTTYTLSHCDISVNRKFWIRQDFHFPPPAFAVRRKWLYPIPMNLASTFLEFFTYMALQVVWESYKFICFWQIAVCRAVGVWRLACLQIESRAWGS